jgi:hypothetical protein
MIRFTQNHLSVHFYNHNLAGTRNSSSFASATHVLSITNKETCAVTPVSKVTKANERREQLERHFITYSSHPYRRLFLDKSVRQMLAVFS